MSSSASDLTTLIAALLAAVPLSYALAALWPARHTHVHRLQSAARCASVLAAVGTLALAGLLAWHGPAVVALPGDGAARRGLTWLSLRLDGVTLAMLLLISLVGFVLVRFSIVYLTGEAGQARYLRWLMATLSAVALLVMANHLLWLAGAWTATSVALHQLLTFYRSRPQALIAAHKKFLISRLADLCLWPALALIGLETGSLELDTVTRRLQTMSVLPSGLETAALLLVIAAALKCAQLPFHGWLTQVMEAPTPVSALLHAGVVNIGGFLMIRLAPLMVKAPAAQTLLVAIATITTVVAALVMTTRVSVKLALAWSTCAQMGLM
ncbi:MAG: proton-conducting transporter membrane subunit, partial [Polyangiales bacterium]